MHSEGKVTIRMLVDSASSLTLNPVVIEDPHLPKGKTNQRNLPLRFFTFSLRVVAISLLSVSALPAQSVSTSNGPTSPALSRDTVAGYIASNQKVVTPQGIEENIPVPINGITQWITIRGRDRRNPVLLYLHGGPGSPFMPLAWTVQRPWEDYFTVVQWDQRGAGKTYAANDPALVAPTLTLPQMISDTEEVIRYLQRHLGKQKIILLGHSWGSVLGVAVAEQHPEWLYAYVGIGQYIDSAISEERGYQFALVQARAQNNREAEQELDAIAPYPGDLDKLTLDKIGIERKWLVYFGGIAFGHHDMSFEDGVETISPDYSQHDLDDIGQAMGFTIPRLLPSLLHLDYRNKTNFHCPVFIFAGRHDYATSHDLAFQWFETIHAPEKKFVWFENSSHLIPEEEPGRFLVELVSLVRPLAVRAGDAPPSDLPPQKIKSVPSPRQDEQ